MTTLLPEAPKFERARPTHQRPSTGEVFATLKPPTKPSLTVWEVQNGSVEGSIRLKNLETGHYLSSSLPSFKVHVVEKVDATCDWKVFNKVHGSLVAASTLDDVFFQNVATSGFMSVRSNEGWTAPGKVWTRGAKPEPAGSYSWEKFQIINLKHEESPEEENKHLKEQLRQQQMHIKHLEEEVAQLQEYRKFFDLFKSLAAK